MSSCPFILLHNQEIDPRIFEECLWTSKIPRGMSSRPERGGYGGNSLYIFLDYFKADTVNGIPRKIVAQYGSIDDWPLVLELDCLNSWCDITPMMLMRLHILLRERQPTTRTLLVDPLTDSPIFVDQADGMVINTTNDRHLSFLPMERNRVDPMIDFGTSPVQIDSTPATLIIGADSCPESVHKKLSGWCMKIPPPDPLPSFYRLGPVEFQINPPGVHFSDPDLTWRMAISYPPNQAATALRIIEEIYPPFTYGRKIKAFIVDRDGKIRATNDRRVKMQIDIHDDIYKLNKAFCENARLEVLENLHGNCRTPE
jgi:hypothetical protein